MRIVPLLLAVAIGFGTTAPAQQPVFRSHAEVVAVHVAVTDRNRSIAGLTAADFELLDSGVPQQILDVTRDRLPLDVTLAIDSSGSVHGRLLASLVRAVNTVRERLRPEDRMDVLSFDSRIRELLPLTPAPKAPRVDIRVGEGPTSLRDVIAVALTAPHDLERRRMAIVFTDGIDTMSVLDEADVVEAARRSMTALFVVATRPPDMKPTAPVPRDGRLPPMAWPAPPEEFFQELATVTGGRVEMVPHVPFLRIVHEGGRVVRGTWGGDERLLDGPFLRAVDEFRASYVLRYAPTGVPRGGWHELTVRVPKRGRQYTVRARQGYSRAP